MKNAKEIVITILFAWMVWLTTDYLTFKEEAIRANTRVEYLEKALKRIVTVLDKLEERSRDWAK